MAQTELVGAARFHATMAKASADLAHLERAATATGRLIDQRAGGAAPKRTGRLASSLVASASGSDARVSSGLVYAGVQHYGWAAHGITAHPFLVPAAEASTPLWRQFYVADVNRALDQVHGM